MRTTTLEALERASPYRGLDVWDYLELFGQWRRQICGAAVSQYAWKRSPCVRDPRADIGRVTIIVKNGELTPRSMWPRSDAAQAFALRALGLERDPQEAPRRSAPPGLGRQRKARPRPTRRRLTPDQVAEILSAPAARGVDLARRYGVSQAAISRIRSRNKPHRSDPHSHKQT